jgi:hypothetical protein
VAAHGGASGRVGAHAIERELIARRRREEEQSAPGGALPEQQLLLSLQQSAGNRAVSGELQRLRKGPGNAAGLHRKVKIGKNPKTAAWMKPNAALPKLPEAFKTGKTLTASSGYQDYIVAKAMKLAADWRNDATELGRTFETDNDFYEAVFTEVVTAGAAPTGTTGNAWSALKAAVKKPGPLFELPWATFAGAVGQALEAELTRCGVQRSSNPATTACHGNTHNKLPKKVVVPGGKTLASLPPNQQYPLTSYIEFLIPGHKSDTEIERGIFDKDSDQIYVTAHYDKGSFVWLSGAPAGWWPPGSRRLRRTRQSCRERDLSHRPNRGGSVVVSPPQGP